MNHVLVRAQDTKGRTAPSLAGLTGSPTRMLKILCGHLRLAPSLDSLPKRRIRQYQSYQSFHLSIEDGVLGIRGDASGIAIVRSPRMHLRASEGSSGSTNTGLSESDFLVGWTAGESLISPASKPPASTVGEPDSGISATDLARSPDEEDMAAALAPELSRLLAHFHTSRPPRHSKRWSEESCPPGGPTRSAKRPCLPTSPHAPTTGASHLARATANARVSDALITTASAAIAQRSERATADGGEIPLSPTTRFPCPCLVQAPQSHLQCHRLDLPTPSSVVRHLAAHHRRPPYCPVCGQTFPSHAACDRHIVARSCAPAAVPPAVGGLTGEQVDRLLELEDRFLPLELPEPRWRRQRVGNGGELERYGAIWDAVFPGTAMPDWADLECV